ncbi:MAG: aminotransferase class III-fold pyridoxal phosphate-dependent enzyme [Cytophagales bacterium]|nr:aminotransferase class III-fold pyridoxal phosphate-dependent enzyme [Bernardetiaceae bacterium]MDW8203547.1 aminotransferase class III-fold pyridoxal phosphate-dependent enzyme [Cytophagales bacterium]
MHLFEVYPLYKIAPVRASGSYLWDEAGNQYLDLYGGHAVISIGHTHPHYVKRISEQLSRIGFYSNSVINPVQEALAQKLGEMCGHPNFSLFMCNSGAEANENALKLASFYNGRTKIVVLKGSFHGRTSGVVAATDNPAIVAPINFNQHVVFVPHNDIAALEAAVDDQTCAVMIEGIQGVGGVHVASDAFWQAARRLCNQHNAVLISDSVQCGYGRSGKFFSHQFSGVEPDLIAVAKGMGNGFPVAGLLIHPKFKPKHGMLGTTFGGNHLACAAALAVLEVMEAENLIDNAAQMGNYLKNALSQIPGVATVRGRGLMLGLVLEIPCNPIRDELLYEHRIFTGSSSDKFTMRLLPALNLTKQDADLFLEKFSLVMQKHLAAVASNQ